MNKDANINPNPTSRAAAGSETWIEVSKQAPPPDTEVETKIDDEHGLRNVTTLKTHGRLWWFPDMSMYTYYCPTHWRHLPNKD